MEKVFIKDKQGNKVLPKTHVSAVYDDEGNELGSHLGAFEDEVRGLVDTPHQEYVTVSATSQTTSADDVLPDSGQSADTIYRVSNWNGSANSGAGAFDATAYSEYAWDGTDYIFLCVKTQIGEVFDITVYNNNTKYADLSAALGTNGANVPEGLRKGGMSVKFVHSSDNKYVQWRLIADEWSTIDTNWINIDEKATKTINFFRGLEPISTTLTNENTDLNRKYIVFKNFILCNLKSDDILSITVSTLCDIFYVDINNQKHDIKRNASAGTHSISLTQEVVSLYFTWASGSDLSVSCSIESNVQRFIDIVTNSVNSLSDKTSNALNFFRGLYTINYLVASSISGDLNRLNFRLENFVYSKIKENESLRITVSTACSIYYFDTDGVRHDIMLNASAGTYTHTFENNVDYLFFTWAIGNDLTINISFLPDYRLETYITEVKYDSQFFNGNKAITKIFANSSEKIFIVSQYLLDNYTLKENDIVKIVTNAPCSMFYYPTVGDRQEMFRNVPAGTYYFTLEYNLSYFYFSDHDALTVELYYCGRRDGEMLASIEEANNYIKLKPVPFTDYKSCYEDSLGKYLRSYYLKQQLDNPYVDRKLSTKDALWNTAGKTFYYDGYVYVLKYSNHLSTGNGESEYLNLAKVSTTDATDVTNIIAFDVDEVLTFSDSSTLTVVKAHEGAIYVDSNGIKVVTLIEYVNNGTTDYQLCYKLFNLSLVQQGNTQKCTITHNGTTYNCNNSELPNELKGTFHDVIFNAGIIKSTIDETDTFIGVLVLKYSWLVSSPDYLNWTTKLNVFSLCRKLGYNPYGEVGVVQYGNKYLIAIRSYGPTLIGIVNQDLSTVEEFMTIKGNATGSLATFFKDGNIIYLMCDGTTYSSVDSGGRNYYKIIKIGENTIFDSEVVCDTNGKRFGPNTILSVDDNHNIYGCVTGVNMILCKFTLPEVMNNVCDTLLGKLLALE